MKKAISSDNLKDTIDYVVLQRIVAEEMEIRSKLLEHVGQRIINKVLLKAPLVNYVKVTVSKVNPPIGGDVAEVSVTLSAKR